MKKHSKKSKMKKMPPMMAADPMEASENEAPMFKRGGKVKKKEMKVEGAKAMARLDRPKYKSGGIVNDISTDKGVSPTSPMAADAPSRGKK